MVAKFKKRRGLLAVLLIIALCAAPTVQAAEGFSYTYDRNEASVPVPAPYETVNTIFGSAAFDGQALSAPTDFFMTDGGLLYLLDAGNSRIVVLNADGVYQKTVLLTDHQKPLDLSGAIGLCVDRKGRLYVADKKAQKVYVTDEKGALLQSIGAPPADKVEEGFVYTPSRVCVDTAGIIYVISDNTYSGALQYDQNGRFLGFYGAERISVTPELLWDEFWKNFLTEQAASGIKRSVPTSFINFDLDAENFVYTIKGGTGKGNGQIRKLNPMGTNVLLNDAGEIATFGDYETYYDNQSNLDITTTFCDLVVDDNGFITALDSTRKRLFQYDQSCDLLYAFGGGGTTKGTYATPVALETYQQRLYVLDAERGSITILRPTVFGGQVRKALSLYQDGQYEAARAPWEAVLRVDANYALANKGMGKLFEKTGDYEKAMFYYHRADDRSGYSEAFAASRDDAIRANFIWLLAGIVLLLSVLVFVVIWKEKHPKNNYNIHRTKKQYPLYCCFHPFKGYEELKAEKQTSMTAALICLFIWFVFAVLSSQLTGFAFNQNKPEEFNVFLTLGSTVGLFLLFVVCNWAASTLLDGEGSFREIFTFTAYALIPYLITIAAMTVFSHVFSLEESAFYMIVQTIGLLWTFAGLFIALREVHQYTMGKTVWVLVLTLLGMYLILIILTIAYSMFAQLLSFLLMVYHELRLKLL